MTKLIIGRYYQARNGIYVGKLVGVQGSLLSFQMFDDLPIQTYLDTGGFSLIRNLSDTPHIAYQGGVWVSSWRWR